MAPPGSNQALDRPFIDGPMKYEIVAPANAGVQDVKPRQHWIPGSAFPPVTFAGMTVVSYFVGPNQ